MPTCPKCNTEIKELIRERDTRTSNVAYVGQDVPLLVNKVEHACAEIGLRYNCPNCKKTLFNKEPRAQRFLVGPKKKKAPPALTPEQEQRQKDVEAFL